MLQKTVINIKADQRVKRNAQKLAHDLGFSLSTVINAYLKQFIRTKEVHFSIAPSMTTELEQLLGVIEKDVRGKRNISHSISSDKELEEYLSAL